MVGVGAFAVVGMLSPLAEGFQITVAQAGWVITVYSIAYAILSPLLVSLIGHVGRRRVLAGGMVVFALASLLAALSSSETVLFATRILAAAGAAVITPVAAAVVGALVPPEGRAKTLANVFFGLTLAQVLGVPASAWLAYTFGWQSPFLVVAVLGLPVAWLIWTRVPAGLTFQPVTLRDLGQVLRDGPLMVAILFTASFLGATYVPFAFLSPLIETGMGFGRDGVSAALLLCGFAAIAGNLAGGRLCDRIGAARTLTWIALIMVPLTAPMSFLPLPLPVFAVALFLWIAGGWSFVAAQQARLIALAPARAPVALALNAASIYVGAALGTLAGTAVLEGWGLMALGLGGAIAMLLPLGHILLSRRLSG